jgi:hypothetical protein
MRAAGLAPGGHRPSPKPQRLSDFVDRLVQVGIPGAEEPHDHRLAGAGQVQNDFHASSRHQVGVGGVQRVLTDHDAQYVRYDETEVIR